MRNLHGGGESGPLVQLHHKITGAVIGLALFGVMALWCCPALAGHQDQGQGHRFLSLIAAEEQSGTLTPDQALLYRFQYVFDPEALPEKYQPPEFSPLKCGTDLVRQYERLKERLDPQTGQIIAGYLALAADRYTFISSEGHFQLSYSLSGEDAVPALDADPANGVPDFVEDMARYLELAWTVEVLMCGFADPLPTGQPYPVRFRAMQAYGYTDFVDGEQGETVIILHNNFLGFPGNDDPDGNAAGAAKVTCAHEFKHASQFAGSEWSEGGWIELDAVWAEELVFDLVNDYYNFLYGGSPIQHPEIPLDGGSTGTGSYEDAVFAIWLQESWGVDLLRDFWERRVTHRTEPVLDSYASVLEQHGQTWDGAWGQFTAWNYATGPRARFLLGYGEADCYPAGPVIADVSSYPTEVTGQVEHLSAAFVRLPGFLPGSQGSLELDFSAPSGADPLTVTVVVFRHDGTGVLEQVDLQGADQVQHTVSVPLQEIESAGVVVGNPNHSGSARTFQLEIDCHLVLPEPDLDLITTQVQMRMAAGTQAQAQVLLGNEGEAGSLLHYQASVWAEDPQLVLRDTGHPDRSVSGSSLVADQATFLPGQELTLQLTLHNESTDDEWLTELRLGLPAGVDLLWATPFVGGSLGDLDWLGPGGSGVTTVWHGEYGTQGYGVIRDGEWATAQIGLAIGSQVAGPLEFEGVIIGDQFGGAPHSLGVSFVLEQEPNMLQVVSPTAGQLAVIGQELEVAWDHGGTLAEVAVSLSRDGGQTWQILAEVPADPSVLSWPVTGPATTEGLVRVTGPEGLVGAVSSGPFTIYPRAPWLQCQPPAGQVPQGEAASLLLEFDSADLPPGEHLAWLLLQHDGGDPAAVVPVSALVTAASGAGPLPRATRLAGAHPNPFNPATSIGFDLERSGPVRLAVMDLRGRLVRRLLDRDLPAGNHRIRWDGRDGAGRAMPSGVYLVRMRADGYTATAKMLLAR
jgi:hypothetical protein